MNPIPALILDRSGEGKRLFFKEQVPTPLCFSRAY